MKRGGLCGETLAAGRWAGPTRSLGGPWPAPDASGSVSSAAAQPGWQWAWLSVAMRASDRQLLTGSPAGEAVSSSVPPPPFLPTGS